MQLYGTDNLMTTLKTLSCENFTDPLHSPKRCNEITRLRIKPGETSATVHQTLYVYPIESLYEVNSLLKSFVFHQTKKSFSSISSIGSLQVEHIK